MITWTDDNQIMCAGQLAGAEDLMPEFSSNRLFLGGDVGGQTGNGNVLQLLHDQKQFANSVEVVNGVYLGGFQAAKKAVRREEIDAVKTCRQAAMPFTRAAL